MLRLTKQTDYGIVLLTYIGNKPIDTAWTARGLADITGIPPAMVGKILKILTRSELLISQRGAQGGYRLARDPKQISVGDIVLSLDGPPALTDCLSAQNYDCIVDSCSLQPSWRRINNAIHDALNEITLHEMAELQNCNCCSDA